MAEYKTITELKKHISDFKKSEYANILSDDFIAGYECALSVFERIIAQLPGMKEGAEE